MTVASGGAGLSLPQSIWLRLCQPISKGLYPIRWRLHALQLPPCTQYKLDLPGAKVLSVAADGYEVGRAINIFSSCMHIAAHYVHKQYPMRRSAAGIPCLRYLVSALLFAPCWALRDTTNHHCWGSSTIPAIPGICQACVPGSRASHHTVQCCYHSIHTCPVSPHQT